jgi:hypothetical protein
MADVTYVEKNYAPKYIYSPDTSRNNLNESNTGTDKRQTMFNAEGGVIPIIYGTQRIGGKIFAVRGVRKTLYIGVILCEGPVDSIISLEVNDKHVSTYSSITYETYLGNQTTASPMLTAAFGTSPITAYTDILPNTCYAVLKFTASDDLSGFPRITATVKGKLVYDPRDSTQAIGTPSTYKWSSNPSLCLADLLRSTVYGLGKEFTTEGWASVTECANLDDVMVGSPSEVRRTLNIIIDKEQETRAWVETLRGYASCFVVPDNIGSMKLLPDKIISYALNLDGVATSYATLPYNPIMALTNGFSFDVSIRPDATISANAVIFAKGASASSATDYLVTYSHGANSTFVVSFNNTGGTKTYTITTGTQLSTTAFTTLSFSLDKNGTSRALLTTDTETLGPQISVLTVTNPGGYTYAPIDTNTYDLRVGYQNGLVAFKGQIDELRIWSRDRLEAEIRKYVRVPLIRNFDASLAVWLPFNEGYASKTYSGSWTSPNKTKDQVTSVWAVINGPSTPWFTPTVAAQAKIFGLYDFTNFDSNNILDKSVKFKKRGILNVPNMVEIGYTDTTVTPWVENYARVDQSTALSYIPSRISMPGINRYSQAKREAIERYNTAFSDTVVTFGAFDETLSLNVGDGVQFHHPLLEAGSTKFFKPYRITGIQQTGYGKYNIATTEYEPSVYSETVATSPTFSDTNLPSINSPVAIPTGILSVGNTTGAAMTEEVYKNQYGIYTSRIRVKFFPADFPYVAEYQVELYNGSTKLEEVRIPAAATISYSNPYTGVETRYEYVSSSAVNLLDAGGSPITYTIKIYTISIARTRSTSTDLTMTTAGKGAKPPDITNFTGYEIGGRVYLSWDEAVDIDIVGYKIKYGDKATLSALSTTSQWDSATALDITDTLKYNAANIASGDRRFLIKALDSVGQESVNPTIKDITVTKDSNSFNIGSATVTGAAVSTSATTNMSSWTARPDPIKWWVSDFGETFSQGGSSLNDTISSQIALNPMNPHTNAKSVWCTSPVDFGSFTSGSSTGYYTGNLTCQVYPTSIHGSYTIYLDYSITTDETFSPANKNITWFEAIGTSCVATVRYARIRVESATSTTDVLLVRDDAIISFDVNTKEEGGIATITNAANGFKVQLLGTYTKAKSILLTPQGTSTVPYIAVFDKVALLSGAGGTQVQIEKTSASASTGSCGLVKTGIAVAFAANDYLEYEVFIQPGSPGETSGLGIMDVITADGTSIGNSTIADQNGLMMNNPNGTGLASGKWYKRSFQIPAAWISGSKSLGTINLLSSLTTPNTTGVARCAYRNIRLTTNQLGSQRVAIYTTASQPNIATDYGWTTSNTTTQTANFIVQVPNSFDIYMFNTAASPTPQTGQVSWVFRGM